MRLSAVVQIRIIKRNHTYLVGDWSILRIHINFYVYAQRQINVVLLLQLVSVPVLHFDIIKRAV